MFTTNSNLHLYNLRINEESESFSQTVPVINGNGQTARTPITPTGEVSYGEITETVIFTGRAFTILDSGYSGDVLITYSAKRFSITKVFTIFLSGITQVNTIVSRIIIKIVGSALAQSIKNIVLPAAFRFTSVVAAYITKNTVGSILINLSLTDRLYSKKNAGASIAFVPRLSNILFNKKNAESDIVIKHSGSIEMSVYQYLPISTYVSMTLNEMKDYTINELTYVTI